MCAQALAFAVGEYPKPHRNGVVDHDADTLANMLDIADEDVTKLYLYMTATENKNDDTVRQMKAELAERREEYPVFAEAPEGGWEVTDGDDVPHLGGNDSYVSPKMLKTVMDWEMDASHKGKG